MTKTPKPTKLDFVKQGEHHLIRGSDKYIIDDHTMYVSESFLMILVYKNNQITHNQSFEDLHQLKQKVDYFISTLKKKVDYAHNLKIGDIFVLNTDLKNIQKNDVLYYQVTKLIDAQNIEIHQLKDTRTMIRKNNVRFYESVPLPKAFVGQSIEVPITLNTFTINDKLATLLTPNYLNITESVKVAIYPPQRFGLTSIDKDHDEDNED